MSYRIEKEEGGTTAIVIEGFENGIASSPHKGIANMQGVNIATETGEAMCSFNRVLQSQTGTSGTLTRVNTNTVSVSGITLLVGQVITITNAGTTGLSGNYYYLSTGKIYAGSLPPSSPDNVSAVTGISAGSATFSITYPLGQPIQKATESYYRNNTQTIYYRYYILDNLGQIWCHDSYTLFNWDTPLWFFVGTASSGASGLAVFNGWLTVSNGTTHMYWKLTSLLGSAWVDSATNVLSDTPMHFSSNANHVMLAGHQGKLYGTDGTFITSLFPNTSLITGAANIQSYARWEISNNPGSELVTNGSFTGSAAGWTVGAGWSYSANTMLKNSDSTGTLSQSGITLTVGVTYILVFTISGWSVGDVTPGLVGVNGTAVSADGTYTQLLNPLSSGSQQIIFTPSNTARFTLDSVSLKVAPVNSTAAIIGGSAPTAGGDTTVRIPAYFYTDTTLPTAILPDVLYYIEWFSQDRFNIYTTATGSIGINTFTGYSGTQYFNTFNPKKDATSTWSSQRVNLPFTETATSLAELGNYVIIGGKSNILYPWDQVSPLPGDLIPLPENNTVNMLTVNNILYVFAGNKGNIYITNGSSASLALKVPDYCAGIAGSPSTYIEPYFTWGDAMYSRGRVYFSILDQTSVKTGNCGGVWSFVPTQNFFIGQDTGQAPRLDNQNSYGTYNGSATVLISNQTQTAIGPQYWSGWYSSISGPTYGIDYTDTIPEETTIIESDLIPTGTNLDQRTFSQIEYKLSTDLASGEAIAINYRQNSTDAWATVGTAQTEGATELSGLFPVNFEKGQWLQFQAILNPLASTSSSFCRLKQLRIR